MSKDNHDKATTISLRKIKHNFGKEGAVFCHSITVLVSLNRANLSIHQPPPQEMGQLTFTSLVAEIIWIAIISCTWREMSKNEAERRGI